MSHCQASLDDAAGGAWSGLASSSLQPQGIYLTGNTFVGCSQRGATFPQMVLVFWFSLWVIWLTTVSCLSQTPVGKTGSSDLERTPWPSCQGYCEIVSEVEALENSYIFLSCGRKLELCAIRQQDITPHCLLGITVTDDFKMWAESQATTLTYGYSVSNRLNSNLFKWINFKLKFNCHCTAIKSHLAAANTGECCW